MESHDDSRQHVSTSVRFDADAQALIGGRCVDCGSVTWPARLVCPRCGTADVEPIQLPRSGSVETWSRLWVPIEGIAPPYVLASVKLGAVRVFGHLQGDPVDEGDAEVEVRVDPDQHPPFWFEMI